MALSLQSRLWSLTGLRSLTQQPGCHTWGFATDLSSLPSLVLLRSLGLTQRPPGNAPCLGLCQSLERRVSGLPHANSPISPFHPPCPGAKSAPAEKRPMATLLLGWEGIRQCCGQFSPQPSRGKTRIALQTPGGPQRGR